MMIFSPRFWQFYAKGVMWTAVIFLPILLLNNYFHAHEIELPYITEAIGALFALGFLIVDVICNYSQICLTQGMSYNEASFFAYFVSILIFGFIVGIYKAWTWLPPKPATAAPVDETKDEIDY